MSTSWAGRLAPFVAGTALLGLGSTALASTSRPAPEWVRQIAPGTWAEVSLNTLADVDPAKDPEINPRFPGLPPWAPYGQWPLLDAWNGGAFAQGYGQYGALILCGGGHADYYGNEVYAFDLDSRRWQRLTNPYPTPSFPIENGIWPDGTPSVSHTYDQVDYHPGTNSFVMMKTQFDNNGGNSSPLVAMFSLENLKPSDSNAGRNENRRNWRLSPLNTANFTQSGGWSAYDSKRDLFWAHGGGGGGVMVSFDPKPAVSDGRFGSFMNFPLRSGASLMSAAYDPVNDIVVFTTFRNAPEVIAVDLNDPSSGMPGNVKLAQSGTPPAREQAHGWEWSPARRAFVYHRRGAEVFEFRQQGNNWRIDPWRWTGLTATSNSVTPLDARTTGSNGPFSRFRIVSFDDAEIAITVTRVDGPVYAFRIPPSEVPRPRRPEDLSAR